MTSSSSVQSPVLGAADIENFLAHGFVHVKNCFDTSPGSTAHRWVEAVLAALRPFADVPLDLAE